MHQEPAALEMRLVRLVWRRKVVGAHGHWDDRGARGADGSLHAWQVEQLGVLASGCVLFEDEEPP